MLKANYLLHWDPLRPLAAPLPGGSTAAPNSLAQRSPPWVGPSARMWGSVELLLEGPVMASSPSRAPSSPGAWYCWDQAEYFSADLQSSSSITPSTMTGCLIHQPGWGRGWGLSSLALVWLPLPHCGGKLWGSWDKPGRCRSVWYKLPVCWLLVPVPLGISACSFGHVVISRVEQGVMGEGLEHGSPCRDSSSRLRSKGSTDRGCSSRSNSWNSGWHWLWVVVMNAQEW
jgi:hypothetical protein